MFSFGAFSLRRFDHSIKLRLFCNACFNALIFLDQVSHAVTLMVFFSFNLIFFRDNILMSLMSSIKMPLSNLPSQDWLTKMLSIRVAVLLVILVGLVILGTKFQREIH